MSLTNQYDPGNRAHTELCGRTGCTELERAPHPAGAHLDQRSEFYDGPDGALGVASVYIRDSARTIIREAPALMPEVMDLVNYVEFMRRQVAAAHADRDRGIREAQARSESCDHHGEQVKALGEQVHAFSEGERRNNAGRLALLGFLHAVDEFTDRYRKGDGQDPALGPVVDALERMSKSTHSAHDRAWKS